MRRGSELVLVLLAGCWGKAPIDLSGVYRVTSHVGSACATDEPVDLPYAYVRMYSGDGYTMDACGSPMADSCTMVAVFPDPVSDDGWEEQGGSITLIAELAECQLMYRAATALLDEGTLVVDTTVRMESVSVNSPACTPDEAVKRAASMPCVSHERIVATELEPL
jgi:hypothetical protein